MASNHPHLGVGHPTLCIVPPLQEVWNIELPAAVTVRSIEQQKEGSSSSRSPLTFPVKTVVEVLRDSSKSPHSMTDSHHHSAAQVLLCLTYCEGASSSPNASSLGEVWVSAQSGALLAVPVATKKAVSIVNTVTLGTGRCGPVTFMASVRGAFATARPSTSILVTLSHMAVVGLWNTKHRALLTTISLQSFPPRSVSPGTTSLQRLAATSTTFTTAKGMVLVSASSSSSSVHSGLSSSMTFVPDEEEETAAPARSRTEHSWLFVALSNHVVAAFDVGRYVSEVLHPSPLPPTTTVHRMVLSELETSSSDPPRFDALGGSLLSVGWVPKHAANGSVATVQRDGRWGGTLWVGGTESEVYRIPIQFRPNAREESNELRGASPADFVARRGYQIHVARLSTIRLGSGSLTRVLPCCRGAVMVACSATGYVYLVDSNSGALLQTIELSAPTEGHRLTRVLEAVVAQDATTSNHSGREGLATVVVHLTDRTLRCLAVKAPNTAGPQLVAANTATDSRRIATENNKAELELEEEEEVTRGLQLPQRQVSFKQETLLKTETAAGRQEERRPKLASPQQSEREALTFPTTAPESTGADGNTQTLPPPPVRARSSPLLQRGSQRAERPAATAAAVTTTTRAASSSRNLLADMMHAASSPPMQRTQRPAPTGTEQFLQYCVELLKQLSGVEGDEHSDRERLSSTEREARAGIVELWEYQRLGRPARLSAAAISAQLEEGSVRLRLLASETMRPAQDVMRYTLQVLNRHEHKRGELFLTELQRTEGQQRYYCEVSEREVREKLHSWFVQSTEALRERQALQALLQESRARNAMLEEKCAHYQELQEDVKELQHAQQALTVLEPQFLQAVTELKALDSQHERLRSRFQSALEVACLRDVEQVLEEETHARLELTLRWSEAWKAATEKLRSEELREWRVVTHDHRERDILWTAQLQHSQSLEALVLRLQRELRDYESRAVDQEQIQRRMESDMQQLQSSLRESNRRYEFLQRSILESDTEVVRSRTVSEHMQAKLAHHMHLAEESMQTVLEQQHVLRSVLEGVGETKAATATLVSLMETFYDVAAGSEELRNARALLREVEAELAAMKRNEALRLNQLEDDMTVSLGNWQEHDDARRVLHPEVSPQRRRLEGAVSSQITDVFQRVRKVHELIGPSWGADSLMMPKAVYLKAVRQLIAGVERAEKCATGMKPPSGKVGAD